MSTPNQKPTENPYIAARTEWNERYGDYIAQAKQWRITALAALGVALVAVFGVAYIGAQARIVPYVVEVNKLGEQVGVTRADLARHNDPRIVKAQLGRWIVNWRSVTPDVAVQKRQVLEMYSYLSNGDPATVALNTYMQENSPFSRSATETVTVDLENILPLSGESWQIDWLETVRSRQGVVTQTKRWRASVTPAFRPPSTEQDILKNPLGLFVKELSWSQQLAFSK